MSPKTTRYLRIVGEAVSFSAEGWTVWSWVSGRELYIGVFQLGPPEYFALCLFFGSAMVAIGWVWIRRIFPSVRFQELSGEIKALVGMMENDNKERGDNDPIVMSYDTYLDVNALVRRLDALGIPWPNPARANTRIWWEWLPRLYGYSRVGNLKEIRKDELIVSESGESVAFGRSDYALVPIDNVERTTGLIIPDQKRGASNEQKL